MEGGFGGEETVDGVEGVFGDDAFFEEGFEFLRGSVRMSGWGGNGGGLAFLMLRRERLVSMTVWRSADTMIAIAV